MPKACNCLGVSPALVKNYKSADEIPEVANEELQKLGLIKKGESFVVTGGFRLASQERQTILLS